MTKKKASKKKVGRKRLDPKGVTDRDGLSPLQQQIKERWRKALRLSPKTSSKAVSRAILDASVESNLAALELGHRRG
ncbi:MAG: hypothetical protein ACI88C_000021 [Acidimicrobiales bacterium]|jgi:hypothetical protein